MVVLAHLQFPAIVKKLSRLCANPYAASSANFYNILQVGGFNQVEAMNYRGNIVPIRVPQSRMAFLVPGGIHGCQQLRKAIVQCVMACSGPGVERPRNPIYHTDFFLAELMQMANEFCNLFQDDMLVSDFEAAFTVVAGVHGRVGEAYYNHEMAYTFPICLNSTHTAHRKLGMVMSAVLLPQQAIDSITALYSAFGVSSRAGTTAFCNELQHALISIDLDAELRAALLGRQSEAWLSHAVTETLCPCLFWNENQKLGVAVRGWAKLLDDDQPVAAFYAAILTILEPGTSLNLRSSLTIGIRDGHTGSQLEGTAHHGDFNLVHIAGTPHFRAWRNRLGGLQLRTTHLSAMVESLTAFI